MFELGGPGSKEENMAEKGKRMSEMCCYVLGLSYLDPVGSYDGLLLAYTFLASSLTMSTTWLA